MLRHGKILVCVLSGLVISTGARAVPNPPGNPYQKIPERNVFNLKKEKPAAVEPEPVQLLRITLTGITTLLGLKRAVLQVEAPARPGAPAGEEFYILAEGQRDRDIEVLQINEAAGTVKVKTTGVPLTLDFINNGAKPPTLPAQPALPSTGVAVPGQPTPTQSVVTPHLPPTNTIPPPPPPAQTQPTPEQPPPLPSLPQ